MAQESKQTLTRFASTVFEQPCRHAAVSEPPTKLLIRTPRGQNDLSVPKLELHLIARLQLGTVAQRLWDYNLSLCANATNHTSTV